jgi:hypothetical protein
MNVERSITGQTSGQKIADRVSLGGQSFVLAAGCCHKFRGSRASEMIAEHEIFSRPEPGLFIGPNKRGYTPQMAKALRSDLIGSLLWADVLKESQRRQDKFQHEKCPQCDVRYTMLLGILEDPEDSVKLLSEKLVADCPGHTTEIYVINEGRIDSQISN